ncbi:hypothetical protein Hanom_Chr04g00356731 [Helianthus anomalus]
MMMKTMVVLVTDGDSGAKLRDNRSWFPGHDDVSADVMFQAILLMVGLWQFR